MDTEKYALRPIDQAETRTLIYERFKKVMAAPDLEAAMIELTIWWTDFSSSECAGCCRPVATSE